MPNLVKELDQSLAYIYCPTCRLMGNPRSQIIRDGHAFRCPLQHTFTGAQLMSSGADMTQMADIQPEQPTITDIKWSIWINPKVKERLEQKFPNRLIMTVATALAALSDDTLVMITGEQGARLRKEFNIKSGAEMLSALESAKQLEQERDEAVKELDKFHKLLAAANISGMDAG